MMPPLQCSGPAKTRPPPPPKVPPLILRTPLELPVPRSNQRVPLAKNKVCVPPGPPSVSSPATAVPVAVTVYVPRLVIQTWSWAVGTWFGDQLAAVFHAPPPVLVQTKSTASAGNVPKPQHKAPTRLQRLRQTAREKTTRSARDSHESRTSPRGFSETPPAPARSPECSEFMATSITVENSSFGQKTGSPQRDADFRSSATTVG